MLTNYQAPRVKYTIKKDTTGEYIVRFHIGGKYRPESNYYTWCKQDAQETARIMVSQITRAYAPENR